MKKYLILPIALLVVISCRKEGIDGPSLQNLYGSFSVLTGLQSSSNTVDFAAGENAHFTATFSKLSNWELRIKGLTSGAEKIVTGLSEKLDANEFTWLGSTTELPMFKAEACQVQLTFPGEVDTLLDTITIVNPKVNAGLVVADFENGFDPGWGTFVQSGANMDFQVKNSTVVAAEKNSYFNLQGEVNWDWLIGLINFNATALGSNTFALSSNPNNVYFNVLVYGEPGLTNSLILFQFDEDENEDGIYNDTNEDRYAVEVSVDWVGWKLVSIKYSDLEALVNGQPSTPNGNGQHNPDKLKVINMLHLANPSSGIAKSKLDYIIFTENEALNP